MTTETVRYAGFLVARADGDNSRALWLNGGRADFYVLAQRLAGDLAAYCGWGGGRVDVRYLTSPEPASFDDALAGHVRTLLGEAAARYQSRYSELTGYLWTDEDFVVGGHDLLAELASHVGEYLNLEVTYHRGER